MDGIVWDMSPFTVPRSQTPLAPQLASQFGLLADPLRLRIVQALANEQLCTCHLTGITGARQTTISNHLRILREAGIVVAEAEGRYTWYRIAPEAFTVALDILARVNADGPEAPRLRPTCET